MSFLDGVKRLLGMGSGGSGGGTQETEMISCPDALAVINEFIDGELEDVSYAEVKAHFDVCQRCYPHLRLEESFRQALHRVAEREAAPEDLRNRVADMLADCAADD